MRSSITDVDGATLWEAEPQGFFFSAKWGPDSESFRGTPVGATYLNALALSQACDPFLFDGAAVWSRAGTRWRSQHVVDDAEGKADLLVHDDTLHLLYHRVTGDGIEAWLATAPLCPQ